MLLIDDSEFNWLAKVIKYNDDFDAIQIEFEDKKIRLELILGKDKANLEARDENSVLVCKTQIDLSKL